MIAPVVLVGEGDGVVVATVAVADRARRGQGLGVPTLLGVEGLRERSGVVPASVPVVMVGIAAELVVAS